MKHDKDTFTCSSHEVDERQEESCQMAYTNAVESFWEEMRYILEENKALHQKKVGEGEEMALHTGAVYALDDAIDNLDRLKMRFLPLEA